MLSSQLGPLLAAVQNSKAKTASGGVDAISCEATVEGETECLKWVIRARESVNEKFCLAAKARDKFKDNDRRNAWPMGLFVEEQIEAYKAEIAEVQKILRTLPANCPHTDWYGTITVVEDIHNRTVLGKESSDDKATRTGTITFNGDDMPIKRSFWEVNAQWVNEKSGGGTRACTGGLRPGVPDTPYTTSSRIEINKIGSSPDSTAVSIGDPDEDSKVQVDFKLGRVDTRVSGQSRSTRTSGCDKDSFDITAPITQDNFRFDYEPVNVTTKLTRKTKTEPEKIVGSETITVMSVSTDRAGMFHTIKVNFRLYKL
jgi:hypothetical protein